MVSFMKSLWCASGLLALASIVGCTQTHYNYPVSPNNRITLAKPTTAPKVVQANPQKVTQPIVQQAITLQPAPPIISATPQPTQRNKIVGRVVPFSYVEWLAQGDNRQRAQEYERFLQRHQVANIIPMHELLRTARSWEKCGYAEYAVPTQELWGNSISTLKIFAYLKSNDILTDFEVTSVYRDLTLNECAGGAKASKHLYNAAIDFRLGSEYPQPHELYAIEQSKNKLCHFWFQHGAGLNMGLGVYRSGQIHIDTQGFRTWGPSLSRESSPCYYLIEAQMQQEQRQSYQSY